MTDIDKLLADLKSHPDCLQDMVQEQIIERDITNQKVVDAFLKVDRKMFIHQKRQSLAYADQPVPIGYSQTISQPYVVAFMTEKLELTKESKVLEIGTGCGYQTAILSQLANYIYSVEVIPELIEIAKVNLEKADIKNVQIYNGNGRDGLEEHAKYSHIIVTAGSKNIPKSLIEQLDDNGKMIIPIGEAENRQKLFLITKNGINIYKRPLLPVRFVPLV